MMVKSISPNLKLNDGKARSVESSRSFSKMNLVSVFELLKVTTSSLLASTVSFEVRESLNFGSLLIS